MHTYIKALELFRILSHNNHKHKYISLELLVKDQRKVVYNSDEEKKSYMIQNIFTNVSWLQDRNLA